MATLQIEKISNGAISVDGVTIFGAPNEVTFGGVKSKTMDYTALGMLGTVELWAGFEKMEMTIKANHVNSSVAAKFGDVTRSKQIQIRTNKEKFSPAGLDEQVALVYKLVATPKDFPGISLKAQEMAEFEIALAVAEVTIEEAGVEIFHFSALANTYRVNGQSIVTTANSNMGV